MFDLENEILKWRKSIGRSGNLDDSDIAELESHFREDVARLVEAGFDEKAAFDEALNRSASSKMMGEEYRKVSLFEPDCPFWSPRRFMPFLFGSYLKLFFRKMKKQKGYSFINIIGLVAGIACCILILLYVRFELSYDAFHEDADRIFRVGGILKTQRGVTHSAGAPPALGAVLKTDFPQVECSSRLTSLRPVIVTYKDNMFKEDRVRNVEPVIFHIFRIPFVKGNPSTALERPNTLVLTETLARKYFGEEDPVGKSIKIENIVLETDSPFYEVTGIVEDFPANTHFKYGILISWKTIERDRHTTDWGGALPTYVKLKKRTDLDLFEESVTRVVTENLEEYLKNRGADFTASIMPVKNIHLYSQLRDELEPPGNPLYILIFSGIGLFILLIASLNFINLSTARSANRAGEVGLRKIVGAYRRQLIGQFIGESILMAFISVVIAVGLTLLALPAFNQVVQTKYSCKEFMKLDMILFYAVISLALGVAAGLYPALFLSTHKPADVIKGVLRSGARSGMVRKVLVVVQFSISIILIIGTMIFYSQLNFMKNRHLGIDIDQRLVIDLQDNEIDPNSAGSIKQEFLKFQDVEEATFASSVPGRWRYKWRLWPTGEQKDNNQLINCMQVDQDFLDVFELTLIGGRWYNEKQLSERTNAGVILNETAVKAYGWRSFEEALSKTFMPEKLPVLGVIKDYHFTGLQNQIEPLSLFNIMDDYVYLILALNTSNLNQTLSSIENKFKKLFPNKLYQHFFLDEDFAEQYRAEERLGTIFNFFTLLGILIACLGLFGLASYMAEQKTKEIGIRKILGAPTFKIVIQLSKEFTKCILIANLIAWPIAYFAVHRWLQEFAYRIKPGVFQFVFSGALALLIALITVSWQSIKAASANPVDSLRYE